MTPPIQTGRADLPHPAFRLVASTMDWLRRRTKGTEIILSAAQALAPLTVFAAVHSRVFIPPKAFSAPARSALRALRRLSLFVGWITPLYLPTSLGSTIITRFLATTDALTPVDSFVAAHRGSLLHATRTSDHSVSNHLRFSTSRFPLTPRWQHHFVGASPFPSGLAKTADRIEFTLPSGHGGRCYGLVVHVQLLSTRGYSPDAVTFSYWPSVSARSGLSPLCSDTLAGALGRVAPRVPRLWRGYHLRNFRSTKLSRICEKVWYHHLVRMN